METYTFTKEQLSKAFALWGKEASEKKWKQTDMTAEGYGDEMANELLDYLNQC